MNATEPRSPDFMEGYRAYKPGQTQYDCPYGMPGFARIKNRSKYTGWFSAWEDYQDRLRQFGE